MAGQNVFKVEVEALDKPSGYLFRGLMIVAGGCTEINEHYSLESETRTRLQTGFDAWAAQVDSEPGP
jgi:hypothetical protein